MYVSNFLNEALRIATALAGGGIMMYALCRLAPLPGTSAVRDALRRIALLGMFHTIFMMPSWIGDENPVLMFPLFVAVLVLCAGGDWLGRLVLSGFFYILLVPLNMAADTFTKWDYHFYGAGENVLPVFAKCGLWGLFAVIICRAVPPDGLRLSRRLWALLGALTLAPLGAMLSLSLWNNHWSNDAIYDFYSMALNRIATTVLPFVLISAFALLFSAIRFSRHEAVERENRLAALRDVYYDGVRQEQAQVRQLRHDLRNHLATLQGLLARGETAQAQAYAETVTQLPALTGGARFCENEVANVVLCCKAAAMQSAGVTADFAAVLPEPLPLPAPELCALLGNALDNAIEAVQAAQDKTVTLRARAEKGLLMLRVENAVNAARAPQKAAPLRQGDRTETGASAGTSAAHCAQDGLFATTKADPTQHGFGLPGMRDIAQRHGGTLEAACENGRFTLLVCIPLG